MSLIKYIKEEMEIIKERDAAIHSPWEVFLYPSFKVMLHYRLAHKLYLSEKYFLARWISQRAVRKTGIEIHPGAKIGHGVFIDHGMGVVIGETAEVGDNCTIYQGATLGGTGKDKGKRHPTLKNNVLVGAGAKVLGPFTVGEHAKIAANAVVLSEVPPYSTCVGVPGRIVKRNFEKVKSVTNQFDHIHTPDPVSMELCKLLYRIECLEKKLAKENENETL